MKLAVENTSLHCDVAPCDWEQACEFDDIPKWHKKPCPKCGRGEIISDADMIAYRMCQAAIAATNDIDPEGKLPRATLRVNTASLRDPANASLERPAASAGTVVGFVGRDHHAPDTEACGKPYPSCCGCAALNSRDCPRMQTANATPQRMARPSAGATYAGGDGSVSDSGGKA